MINVCVGKCLLMDLGHGLRPRFEKVILFRLFGTFYVSHRISLGPDSYMVMLDDREGEEAKLVSEDSVFLALANKHKVRTHGRFDS